MLTIGKTYRIIDVPQNTPCDDCQPCIKLRLMELGFICGERIKVKKYQMGIWLVVLLTDYNEECQTMALRHEELDRIILEEE
jgi:Fe2+ transport system protein FeoA